jgi:hypothetical protein
MKLFRKSLIVILPILLLSACEGSGSSSGATSTSLDNKQVQSRLPSQDQEISTYHLNFLNATDQDITLLPGTCTADFQSKVFHSGEVSDEVFIDDGGSNLNHPACNLQVKIGSVTTTIHFTQDGVKAHNLGFLGSGNFYSNSTPLMVDSTSGEADEALVDKLFAGMDMNGSLQEIFDQCVGTALAFLHGLGGTAGLEQYNYYYFSVIGPKSYSAQSINTQLNVQGNILGVTGNHGKVVLITDGGSDYGQLYSCDAKNYSADNCNVIDSYTSGEPVAVDFSTDQNGFVLTGSHVDGYKSNTNVSVSTLDDLGIQGNPLGVSGNNGTVYITTSNDNSSGSLYECDSDNYKAHDCYKIDTFASGKPVSISMSQEFAGFVLTSDGNGGGNLDGYTECLSTKGCYFPSEDEDLSNLTYAKNTSIQSLDSLGISGTPISVSSKDGAVFITVKVGETSGVLYRCKSSNYHASDCQVVDAYESDYPVGSDFSTDQQGFTVTSNGYLHGYPTE